MRSPETKSNPAPASASAPVMAGLSFRVWLIAALLALVTIALYWPAMQCDFVNFDDDLVVTSNAQVQEGLTWENAKWAFVNPVNSIWHPLTVMSHMLDCQMFGLKPWGHHLSSVLLHVLNTVLVFVLLQQMTGVLWRSVMVAALFGWHPLHVESVAWVAERKDVLSGLFFMLTLGAYERYARKRSAPGSRLWTFDYCLTLLFFALGLMSKPMLVTVPCVMLLLDYWPLGRVTGDGWRVTGKKNGKPSTLNPQLSTLLLEKLPFFGLAAVASVVTYVVQRRGGAMVLFDKLPLDTRLGNALISYCRYLGKLFWPVDLAVFYPHLGKWPLEQVWLAGVLLLGISALLVVKRGRYPFMLMGWLWYCGTLVPVIGMVQVGGQAMADRYTYIPSLGVLILAIWGVYELTRRWRYQVMVLSGAACVVVVLCFGLTQQQLGYWKDNEALFRHALAVTENNYLAYNNLGFALGEKGQIDKAISQYQEAIRLKSNYAEAHNNLGNALGIKGQIDKSINQFQEAIRLKPDYAAIHYNLGIALDRKGQTDEAIGQYREAIRLVPSDAHAHNNLGIILDRKGQTNEAISQYRETIRLKPDFDEAHYNLAKLLAAQGQLPEAVSQYRTVIRLKPDSADAHGNLANVLATQGKLNEAVQEYQRTLKLVPNSAQAHFRYGQALQGQHKFGAAMTEYQKALDLAPQHLSAHLGLAWLLATCPDSSLRDGKRAVEVAQQAVQLSGGKSPEILDTLAAAYAEAGRFPEAVETAKRALNLNATRNNQPLADALQMRLKLYEANAPYHEKP
jgi:tetratricopeptide (TPR) repeat protein